MKKMIIGVFSDTDEAENTISELEKYNYNPRDISVIMKDNEEGKNLAKKSGADVTSKAVYDATTGGVLGALRGLGIATIDATTYEKSIKEDGILVAVPTFNGDEGDVLSLLDKHGADKVRSVNYGDNDFEHYFAV